MRFNHWPTTIGMPLATVFGVGFGAETVKQVCRGSISPAHADRFKKQVQQRDMALIPVPRLALQGCSNCLLNVF